jgi:hypothetical protein
MNTNVAAVRQAAGQPELSRGARAGFQREVEHWKIAAERLADLELVAPPQAWRALEHYLGVSLRTALTSAVDKVKQAVAQFETVLHASNGNSSIDHWQLQLTQIRQLYFRAETTVDFYADCLATRANPRFGAVMRACDHIATRSMAEALTPMGREVPAALTYLDKGLGASVLKAGLRLWDGTVENPVATIKITRHNLLRPSAIIHEAGHQVMHMLGWVPELAEALRNQFEPRALGSLWASWSSEIAADAFAHVHAGFAAAAALHDVLDGSDPTVFHLLPGDPHPVSYLRVLMVLEFCRASYGAGPWDSLAAAWLAKHRLSRCPTDVRSIFQASARAMPRIATIILNTPYRAFGNRALPTLVDPQRVSPKALAALERDAGSAAFTSTYWTWTEAIRLLALTGFRAGESSTQFRAAVQQQHAWMLRLGLQRAA